MAAQEQLIASPSPLGSPLTGPQVKKRGPSTAMMAATDRPISPQLADAFFAAVREYVRWSYMGAEPGLGGAQLPLRLIEDRKAQWGEVWAEAWSHCRWKQFLLRT